jgi:hypothetical protein
MRGTHTPRPWTAEGRDVKGPLGISVAYALKGSVFAAEGSYTIDNAQATANAHLFAAAPDYHDHAHHLAMLVLQSPLYASDPDVREQVDNVLAIHAKAEGRS